MNVRMTPIVVAGGLPPPPRPFLLTGNHLAPQPCDGFSDAAPEFPAPDHPIPNPDEHPKSNPIPCLDNHLGRLFRNNPIWHASCFWWVVLIPRCSERPRPWVRLPFHGNGRDSPDPGYAPGHGPGGTHGCRPTTVTPGTEHEEGPVQGVLKGSTGEWGAQSPSFSLLTPSDSSPPSHPDPLQHEQSLANPSAGVWGRLDDGPGSIPPGGSSGPRHRGSRGLGAGHRPGVRRSWGGNRPGRARRVGPWSRPGMSWRPLAGGSKSCGADLGTGEAAEEVCDRVLASGRPIDVLVNNVGGTAARTSPSRTSPSRIGTGSWT